MYLHTLVTNEKMETAEQYGEVNLTVWMSKEKENRKESPLPKGRKAKPTVTRFEYKQAEEIKESSFSGSRLIRSTRGFNH